MLDVFRLIAFEEGKKPEEVYQEIQAAIDEAWENPQFRLRMIRLTHSFQKPDPDSLISSATRHLNKK